MISRAYVDPGFENSQDDHFATDHAATKVNILEHMARNIDRVFMMTDEGDKEVSFVLTISIAKKQKTPEQ